jgi:hypothetical protein
MAWRYLLGARFELLAPELVSIAFANRWLEIRHCRLAIAPGYAWDGCSPAARLPGGIWIGTPDGPLAADGRPVAWRASMVHDALCQFRPDIAGLAKSATVDLFRRMLIEDGAPGWMCALYPAAVWHFGPQEWGGLNSQKVPNKRFEKTGTTAL